MRAAARTSGLRGTRESRNGHSLGRILFAVVLAELFAVLLAEFRRAVTAARHYEHLRYGSGRREGMAPTGVPRRVFEEFYSDARPVESHRAEVNPQITWHRSAARGDAAQGERSTRDALRQG
jgi:hypothetical protein